MPTNSPDGNGWNEWSRYVLKQLEDMGNSIKELRDAMIKLTLSAAESDRNYAALTEARTHIGANQVKLTTLEKQIEKISGRLKVLYYIGGLLVTVLLAVVIKWLTSGLGL